MKSMLELTRRPNKLDVDCVLLEVTKMTKKIKWLETESEIRVALDHYRMKIMMVYNHEGKPLTVKQIADIMGDAHSKVHYHVKRLIGINLLELDHTKNINGIIAKYYRPRYSSVRMPAANAINKKKVNELAYKNNSNYGRFAYLSNSFREDIQKYIDNVQESIDSKALELSMSKQTLYMTEKEAEDLIDGVFNLIGKYVKKEDTKINKNKSDYTGLLGVVKTTK